jgi:hypothetical protein
MKIRRLCQRVVVVALVANGIACGKVSLPITLGLQGDRDFVLLHIPASNPNAVKMDLEGGVETVMDVEINLFDLLSGNGSVALIRVEDLLFGGTPFTILGVSTGDVCIVLDEVDPGSGMAVIDLRQGTLDIHMLIHSSVKVGSPLLSEIIPGGSFAFPIAIEGSTSLTLAGLLGLLAGGHGGLSITQDISTTLSVPIGSNMLPIGVEAHLTIETIDALPTGRLIDRCAALPGL